MVVFPNCKINLGLHILDKRKDGYHNLQTIFYPLPFTDVLELIPNKGSKTAIEFTGTGIAIDGKPEDNLCIKAYHLLKKDFPQLPPVKVHLHKAIPMGAGLGGGSANASFMLRSLNEKFGLLIPESQLIQYALQLGSDCPFFIKNKPCFAKGRGELLEEIVLDLSAYKIIVVNPGIHINTGWAFSKLADGSKAPGSLIWSDGLNPPDLFNDLYEQPVETWKNILKNDFEIPVFEAYPAVKAIKETLYTYGALYASMSGSGSTVFGIFTKSVDLSAFKEKNYFTKIIN